jgi:3-hydroxyisobutyrate dehydrogenase-like beta-hydroxyacid dehydrogenase
MLGSGHFGFIGTGVMGEPMCRNLGQKGDRPVVAFDRDPAPLARLAAHGIRTGESAKDVVRGASVVFLSLPSGEAVEALCMEAGGLLETAIVGQIVVDTGTSQVALTRSLAERFAARGVTYVDAPVARTRAAAEAGQLSVMVGADPETFAQLEPLFATFATDITLCGPIGCGQVVKILNNMVLFQTVAALSEACAISERSGVAPDKLLATLSKGSADSFALRNHGQKAIVPGVFPERAFSVRYARKDLGYAVKLADDAGVDAKGARLVDLRFVSAIEAGFGEKYFPVISRIVKGG